MKYTGNKFYRMKIAAQVLDKATGKPIPGASVQVTDTDYKALGTGTQTDADGKFVLINSFLDRDDTWVTISSVGYETKDFPPARFSGYTIKVDLEPKSAIMDEVVITAVKKPKPPQKPSYAVPIALCSAAVVTLGIYFFIK